MEVSELEAIKRVRGLSEPSLNSRQVAAGGINGAGNILQPLPFVNDGRNNPLFRGPGSPFSPLGVASGNGNQRGGLPVGLPQAGASSSLIPLPNAASAAPVQSGAATSETVGATGQISIVVPPTVAATGISDLAQATVAPGASLTPLPGLPVVTAATTLGANNIRPTAIFSGATPTAIVFASQPTPDSEPAPTRPSAGVIAGSVVGALVGITLIVMGLVFYRKYAGKKSSTQGWSQPWSRGDRKDPEKDPYTMERSLLESSRGLPNEPEILPPLYFEKLPVKLPIPREIEKPAPEKEEITTKQAAPPKVKLFEGGIGGSPSPRRNQPAVVDFSRPLKGAAQSPQLSSTETSPSPPQVTRTPSVEQKKSTTASKTKIIGRVVQADGAIQVVEVAMPKPLKLSPKSSQPATSHEKVQETKDKKENQEVREKKNEREMKEAEETKVLEQAKGSEQARLRKETKEQKEVKDLAQAKSSKETKKLQQSKEVEEAPEVVVETKGTEQTKGIKETKAAEDPKTTEENKVAENTKAAEETMV